MPIVSEDQVATVKKTRKPRPKPARSIALELAPNTDGQNAVVRITVGKETGRCTVSALPSDWGHAYSVQKIGTEDIYHVNLDGFWRTCDCKGHSRWQRCKHADGLVKPVEVGKL
jgi:hypothetical protein